MEALKRPPEAKPPHKATFRASRRAWNSFVGEPLSHRNIMAAVALGALALAGQGQYSAHTERQKRQLQVVIVERDPSAVPLRAQAAQPAGAMTDAQIGFRMRTWVNNVRTVLTDRDGMREKITAAYNSTRRDSEAHKMITAFHQTEDPAETAKKSTRSVYRETAIAASGAAGRTWEVMWCERRMGRDGALLSVEHWRALVSYEIDPPTDTEMLLKNPDGWFVTAAPWTRIQGGPERQQPTGPNRPAIAVPEYCL